MFQFGHGNSLGHRFSFFNTFLLSSFLSCLLSPVLLVCCFIMIYSNFVNSYWVSDSECHVLVQYVGLGGGVTFHTH